MANITLTVHAYLDGTLKETKSGTFAGGQNSTYKLWAETSLSVTHWGYFSYVHEYDAPGAGSYDTTCDFFNRNTTLNRNTIFDIYYVSTRPSKYKVEIRGTLDSAIQSPFMETGLLYTPNSTVALITAVHDSGWNSPDGTFTRGIYNNESYIYDLTYSFTITENTTIWLSFSSGTTLIPTNVRVSPSEITTGDGFALSWDWNISADTSGWFDVYYGTSSDYSSSILVNSVHPSSTSARTQSISVASWSRLGGCYFWITYRPNLRHSSSYALLTVRSSSPTVQGYIYNGSSWVTATPYIWNGSQWQEVVPNIYDNGEWE